MDIISINMGLKDRLLAHRLKKKTVVITIPDESYALVESPDMEGAKALMVINATLKLHKDDIPLKQVFGYYCSVIFDYNDVDDDLWPTSEEFSIMQDYVETFDKALKVNDEHPNALFVARVTHKGTCQMIWMLHDAQTAIKYLDEVISRGDQIREFEYSIEGDPEWNNIGWFLQDFPSKSPE